MELFTLLGKLIDRNEWTDPSMVYTFYEHNNNYAWITTTDIEDIDSLAKSILDIDDCVECQDYDNITFVFDKNNNYDLVMVRFGEEEHWVNVSDSLDSTMLELYHKICWILICEF